MAGRPPSIDDDALLAAARAVFIEDGHKATTAKIAARAGVSEGTVFYRFKSRDNLLAAVVRRAVEPDERLRAVAARGGRGSAGARLKALVEQLLADVLQTHPLVELAMTSPRAGDVHRALFEGAEAAPRRTVSLLAAAFETEIEAGRMRRVDTEIAARAVLGACIDFARAGGAADDAAARRRFVRGFVDLLRYGVDAAAPKGRRRA